jgi:hypothetical protein
MVGGKAYGEIDFEKEAREVGVAGLESYRDIEKKLSDEMGEAAYRMAYVLSGQGKAGRFEADQLRAEGRKRNIQEATMDIFKVPGAGDKLKEGLALLGTGKPEDAVKGKAMIGAIAADYMDDLTDEQRDILIKMGDPNRKDMDKALIDMGKVSRAGNYLAGKEQIARRMQRFQAAMSGNQEEILSAANRIRKRAGGGALEIGDKIRQLMTTTDPRQHANLLAAITRSAAEADPRDAAAMSEALRGVQGGEGIQVALKAGSEVGALVTALQRGGKMGGREAMGASNILLGLGARTGVSASDLRALRRGKSKEVSRVEEKVLGDLEGKQREAVKQALQAFREPGKDLTAIMEAGIKGGIIRGQSMYGDPKKSITSYKDPKAGDIVGRKGSPEGMHMELSRQSAILQSISDKLGAVKVVGNESGGQGPEDKKAED